MLMIFILIYEYCQINEINELAINDKSENDQLKEESQNL